MRAPLALCGLLLLTAVPRDGRSQALPTPAPAVQDSFLPVGDVRIRFRVEGHGPAVLLLHGFAGRMEDLDGLAAGLRDRFRVIRLDLRGFGESGHPHAPVQYGLHFVQDILAVLDHVGERRASLVGYSLGAAVAAKAAALHPERVTRLALIGGGPLTHNGLILRISDSAAAALEDGRGLRPFFVALTPPSQPMPPDSVMQAVSRTVLSTGDSLAWAAHLRSQYALAVGDSEIRALRMATLLLAGTNDPLGDEARAWPALLPHARFIAIKGASHDDVLGQSAVTREVRAFLLARAIR